MRMFEAVLLIIIVVISVSVRAQEAELPEQALRAFELYELSQSLYEGWIFLRDKLKPKPISDAENASYRQGVAAAQHGDYDQAAQSYRKAAEVGFAPAQNELGLLYLWGVAGPAPAPQALSSPRFTGVRFPQPEAASELFCKAASYAPAQYNLGLVCSGWYDAPLLGLETYRPSYCLASGDCKSRRYFADQLKIGGTKVTDLVPNTALAWFRKAADGDYPPAELVMAYVAELREDWSTAKWWLEQARQRYGPAQAELGWCYAVGKCGPTNYDAAFKWTQKASAQHVLSAKNNLAVAYLNGQGVEQDAAEAKRLFDEVRAQSCPAASVNFRQSLLCQTARDNLKIVGLGRQGNWSQPLWTLLPTARPSGVSD